MPSSFLAWHDTNLVRHLSNVVPFSAPTLHDPRGRIANCKPCSTSACWKPPRSSTFMKLWTKTPAVLSKPLAMRDFMFSCYGWLAPCPTTSPHAQGPRCPTNRVRHLGETSSMQSSRPSIDFFNSDLVHTAENENQEMQEHCQDRFWMFYEEMTDHFGK